MHKLERTGQFRRDYALYGSTATAEQAAAAKKPYADLDPDHQENGQRRSLCDQRRGHAR